MPILRTLNFLVVLTGCVLTGIQDNSNFPQYVANCLNLGVLRMSITTRTIKKINIDPGTRETVIQFLGNSKAIEAMALDFRMDTGDLTYLLLDRLVHKSHETAFEYVGDVQRKYFSVTGCVTSELKPIAA